MNETRKSDPVSTGPATPSDPTAEQDSGHGLFAPSSYEAVEQFLNAILSTTPSSPPSRRQSQEEEEEEDEEGTLKDKDRQKHTQKNNSDGETTPTKSSSCHASSRSAVAETWRTQAIGLVGLALLIHEVRHEVLADETVARAMVTAAAGEGNEEVFKEADREKNTISPGPAVTEGHSRRSSSDNHEFEVGVEEEEEEVDSWARGVEDLTVRLLESLGSVGRRREEGQEEDDRDIQDDGEEEEEEDPTGWYFDPDESDPEYEDEPCE